MRQTTSSTTEVMWVTSSEPEWYLFSLCVTRLCVRRLVCCLPPPPPPPLPFSFPVPPLPLPPLPAKHHTNMRAPSTHELIKRWDIARGIVRLRVKWHDTGTRSSARSVKTQERKCSFALWNQHETHKHQSRRISKYKYILREVFLYSPINMIVTWHGTNPNNQWQKHYRIAM